MPLVGVVGVPLITPAALRLSPAGNMPDFTLHVRVPFAPVAVSVCEYGELTTPSFKPIVLIARGETMLMLSARNAVLGVGDESVSVTTKLNVPTCVGVPEIVPEDESSVRPVGNAPLLTLQLVGEKPPKPLSVVE